MHTWWRGNWEGADKVNPPGTHQQQVQQRRQRGRAQETYRQESQTAESAVTQAADRVTPKQAQAVGTSITTDGTPRRKRTVQQIDAEEQADRAATEIVELVEQDAQTHSRVLNSLQQVNGHAPVIPNGHGHCGAVGIH